jgi:Spy/CpxP family protein refolding chaperone
MKKVILFGVWLAAGFYGMASSVWAAPEGRALRPHQRIQRMSPQQRQEQISHLQLTVAQRQAARQRKAAYRKRMIELKSQLDLRRVDRDSELEKAAPDKAKLQKLSEEIGRIRGQMIAEETNARVDFEKLLTPEQLVKWRELKKNQKNTEALDSLGDGAD